MIEKFSKTTFSEGKESLQYLIDTYHDSDGSRNEAETRFQIIDDLLEKCFGWPKNLTHVEVHDARSYTDYEIGNPRQVIWEAKREGNAFHLPATGNQSLLIDLPSLMDINNNVKSAISQVRNYCLDRGVQIAVVSNGWQLIAFLASRSDGIPPLSANALVFRSLEHLKENFRVAWQTLSYPGTLERRLIRYLSTGETGLPRKLSTYLLQYPKYRYTSEIQATLKQLSELLIQDIVEDPDIEEKFYKRCYCESGAISKYTLMSRKILRARYSAMFDETESHPHVVSARPDKNTTTITPDLMGKALSRRPIVLIGDIGVGKTSFIKQLTYVSAYKEFRNALFIYIDLGSEATLTNDIKTYILVEVETQLFKKYGEDVYANGFVRGVYASEISRFSKGIWGPYQDSNPEFYDEKLLAMLDEKLTHKDLHLREAINHLSRARKKQVIIALDNADQRQFSVQQEAFLISQEFAKDWSATVFMSVRPQTFHMSQRSGTLAAYPQKVFAISPPRVDAVIEKRLLFALDMAEGKIPLETIESVTVNIENLALFLKALLRSLKRNPEIAELLENITGGNVRAAIDLVTKFIGSPNVNAVKIIRFMEEKKPYLIPLHEFSKAALLAACRA